MPTAKTAIAVCASVLALVAVAASSASGAEWNVAKAPLGSGKAASLAEANTPAKSFELTIGTTGLTVTCTGLRNSSAALVGPASFEAKSLVFTGCKSNSANCAVASEVSTTEVLGSAALATSPASTLTIAPRAGAEKVLIELHLLGSLCAIETLPVKGSFTFTLPNGQSEATSHELSVSSSSLKTGSSSDTLTGAVDASLASGSAWSFH